MQASQGTGFSSSIIWLRDLDSKEGWGQETWRVWTLGLEEDAEHTLDSKENKWISEAGGESYHHTRDDRAETEANILWARSEGGRFGKFSNARDGEKGKQERGRGPRTRCLDTVEKHNRLTLLELLAKVRDRAGWRVGSQGGRSRPWGQKVTRWRQKYFRAINGIFGKIGIKSSPEVSISLVNSFCLPILLYSMEAVYLYKRDVSRLDAAYSQCFSKIFNSWDATTINQCQFFMSVLPVVRLILLHVLQVELLIEDCAQVGLSILCI